MLCYRFAEPMFFKFSSDQTDNYWAAQKDRTKIEQRRLCRIHKYQADEGKH